MSTEDYDFANLEEIVIGVPNDVWYEIFSYCARIDLDNIRCVNKQFYQTVKRIALEYKNSNPILIEAGVTIVCLGGVGGANKLIDKIFKQPFLFLWLSINKKRRRWVYHYLVGMRKLINNREEYVRIMSKMRYYDKIIRLYFHPNKIAIIEDKRKAKSSRTELIFSNFQN